MFKDQGVCNTKLSSCSSIGDSCGTIANSAFGGERKAPSANGSLTQTFGLEA